MKLTKNLKKALLLPVYLLNLNCMYKENTGPTHSVNSNQTPYLLKISPEYTPAQTPEQTAVKSLDAAKIENQKKYILNELLIRSILNGWWIDEVYFWSYIANHTSEDKSNIALKIFSQMVKNIKSDREYLYIAKLIDPDYKKHTEELLSKEELEQEFLKFIEKLEQEKN